MRENANKEIVLAFFRALGGGDFAALPRLASRSITYTIYGTRKQKSRQLPWAGRHHGFRELETAFQLISEALEVHDFQIDTILAEGDVVLVHGGYEATYKQTGKRFETKFAQRVKFDEDVIFDCVMLEDSYAVFEAGTAK